MVTVFEFMFLLLLLVLHFFHLFLGNNCGAIALVLEAKGPK